MKADKASSSAPEMKNPAKASISKINALAGFSISSLARFVSCQFRLKSSPFCLILD